MEISQQPADGIDRCPTCAAPTHASESDDTGRCADCAPMVAVDGRPGILDITETATGVLVTWLDDDIDAGEQSAEVAYWYERPDRSVGICGGYVADGDAPEWILEAVAAWAEAQASGRADDAAERRAECRAEAL